MFKGSGMRFWRICAFKAETEGYKACIYACCMDYDDAYSNQNGAELHKLAAFPFASGNAGVSLLDTYWPMWLGA